MGVNTVQTGIWQHLQGLCMTPRGRKVKIFEGVQEYRVLWTLDMKENPWARLLAYVTGLINQELLLKNEYLAAENRILRAHLPARLRLSDPERSTLAEIGKRLGRKALAQVACVAKPDTILAWSYGQKTRSRPRVNRSSRFGALGDT